MKHAHGFLPGTQDNCVGLDNRRRTIQRDVQPGIVNALIADPGQHLNAVFAQGIAQYPSRRYPQAPARFAGFALQHGHSATAGHRSQRITIQGAGLGEALVDAPYSKERSSLFCFSRCRDQIFGHVKPDAARAHHCNPRPRLTFT